MATYIALSHWTQKGIENVKQSPDRLEKFKQALKTNGGTLKAFYLTMGRYDFVAISNCLTTGRARERRCNWRPQEAFGRRHLRLFRKPNTRRLLGRWGSARLILAGLPLNGSPATMKSSYST